MSEADVAPDELSEMDLFNIKLSDLSTQLEILNFNYTENKEILEGNLDNFFLIVMGCIVFLMQAGFAFLEAGAVRSKNTVNILIKNMLDALIGGVSYWAIGWALAYGKDDGSGFIGTSQFFSHNMNQADFPSWFFQFVFAATAATIVSGAIAERCTFTAYFCYSVIITAWMYPPVSHWGWHCPNKEETHWIINELQENVTIEQDCGWLVKNGYTDFAGSGIVHVLGGVCAGVGCYFMKPRAGRFSKSGPIDMPGHSVPLAGLGGFILLFGFLAFNGGSQLSITNPGDSAVVGIVIVNTIIGGCSGGLAAMFITWFQTRKWSYLITLNGCLTGMVAQCAGCNNYPVWASLIIGAMGGAVFHGVHWLEMKARMDDPLDAVPVHFGGGVLGVICGPIFKAVESVDGIAMAAIAPDANTLGWNILGLLIIILWAAFWSTLMFGGLSLIKKLRIDRETEFKGNDQIKHGESAYPRDAWIEVQYQMKNEKHKGDKNQANADALPPNMQGSSNDQDEKNYNNAFEMMPTFGMLHKASAGFMAGNFRKMSSQDSQENENQGQDNKAMDSIAEN